MQFDVVGMSRCHGELLGATSLPESLTVKLDGEGTEMVQALGLTTMKLAWHKCEGWNKHIIVVPLLCCVMLPHALVIPCHRCCRSIVVLCFSEASWEEGVLTMVSYDKEQ